MAQVDKKFIVELQGKQFILYDGLLDMAHQMELQSIATEMVQYDGKVVIFKATATTKDGRSFDGYGDADTSNVNKMIAKHMIRMAETRAKARALRDLTNVGMCSVEELGGDDAPPPKRASTAHAPSKVGNQVLTQIKDRADQVGVDKDSLLKMAQDMFGVKKSTDMTPEQAAKLDAALIEKLVELRERRGEGN